MDIKDVTINYSGQEFVEDEPDPRFPQQYHFRRFLFWGDLNLSYADTTINISEKTKINIDGNRLVMAGLKHTVNRMGYNVGVYNQGSITTSASGKNNYIMSSVVFDQGGHPERLFFVNGDKDSNIGVDAVKYGNFLLFHGHQLEPLYQYKKLYNFVNLFKSKKYKGLNKEQLYSLYKKIAHEHYIIGHFRQDKAVCGSRILEPRQLYLLKNGVIFKL